MSRFHITKNGDAAPCSATTRACPLGGEHYDSMEDAALAVMDRETFGATRDCPLGGLTYPSMEDAAIAMDVERDVKQFREETTAYGEHFDSMENELDGEQAQDELDSDDDLDAYLAQWDEEQHIKQLEDDLEDDWDPPTAEELEDFRSAEEDARFVVAENQKALFRSMPTEWGEALLDQSVSEDAAKELQSYSGMKALDLLAQDLEAQARADHAAGHLTDRELEEELHVVGALRYLIDPAIGRRHGPREQKPIDPQLIQALRCLYIKKFGVDPFEKGVSVPELLQMRQNRLI